MLYVHVLLGWAVALMVFLLVGRVVLRLTGARLPFQQAVLAMAWELAIGWIATMVLVALFLTRGLTILLPAGLLLGYMVWQLRRPPSAQPVTTPRFAPISWQTLLLFAGYLLAFATIAWLNVYDWELGIPLVSRYQPEETLHYAQVSAWLTNGHESRNFFQSQFDLGYAGTSSYHYGDLYTNLLFSWFALDMPVLHALHLVAKPFMQALASLLLFGQLCVMAPKVRLRLLFAVLTPLSLGFVFVIYPIQSWSYGVLSFHAYYSPLIMEKLLPLLIPATMAAQLWWLGKPRLAVLCLLLLPLFNIGAAPGIFGGLGLFAVLSLLRKSTRKEAAWVLASIVFVALYIVVFYVLTARELEQNSYSVNYEGLRSLTLSHLKGELLLLLIVPLYFTLQFAPVSLLAGYLALRRRTRINGLGFVRYVLLCVFCLLVAWVVFRILSFSTKDAFQLFWTLTIPLSLAVLFALLVYASGYLSPKRFAAITLIWGALMLYYLCDYVGTTAARPIAERYRYSPAYVAQVDSLFAARPQWSPVAVGLKENNDYRSSTQVDTWIFGPARAYAHQPQLFFENLTWDRLPENMYDIRMVNEHIEQAYYNRWLAQQPSASRGAQMARFVQQHQVQLGVAYRHAEIPAELRALVQDSIVDARTGQRLLIFE